MIQTIKHLATPGRNFKGRKNKMQVQIEKITIGKDKKLYLTLSYPFAVNKPTLVFLEWNSDWLTACQKEMEENYDHKN